MKSTGLKGLLRVENEIVRAELHLDGLNTHVTRMGEKCALFGSAYQMKIADALGAVRAARGYLRQANGSKQWTITTRGSKNNTYLDEQGKILWDCQYRKKNWSCPFDSKQTAERPLESD